MNNLPSFRPRAAIGASAQNGSVNASPEFLRWLDQMRNSIESSSILPGTVSTSLSSGEPSGWKKLNGQALRKASYADLYAVIGDGFGSTATTFNLPDMSNRVLIGAGTIGLGNEGGEDSVTLTVSNLPAHSHGITDPGHTHSITDPGHAHGGVLQPGTAAGFTGSGDADYPASTDSNTTGITVDSATTGISVQNTGSGDAFDIVPLALGITVLVKT